MKFVTELNNSGNQTTKDNASFSFNSNAEKLDVPKIITQIPNKKGRLKNGSPFLDNAIINHIVKNNVKTDVIAKIMKKERLKS